MFTAHQPRLVGDAFGEERGSFVAGEAEVGLCGGKCRDEVSVVLTEVLRGVEEIAEVGLIQPVPHRVPFTAIGQRNDEFQFGEGSRRNFNVDELVHGLDVGCGSSVGAVDQPVTRERHTGYPVIPGSTIKGVLADLWTVKSEKGEYVREKEGIRLLGNDPADKKTAAQAGTLLIGEGKLLAFPVRSAKGCWAWLTCPLIIDRFVRDTGAQIGKLEDGKIYADEKLQIDGKVVFEEYPLTVATGAHADVIEAFKTVSIDPVWTDNLAGHLAIISNDLFAYFAKNACEIANHNRINDETGVVEDGALFSQENVPSETMFYGIFSSRDAEDFDKLGTKLEAEGGMLQIGADATTGLGWCSVTMK